jgi:hypothetical protein
VGQGRAIAHELGPITIEIAAPAALVFQMLSAIGQGPQRPGERAEVLARDGERLVCEFTTSVRLPLGRRRLVRTREAVRVCPPDRLEYEHLDGPVKGLRESITIAPLAERRSRLEYRASYRPGGRLADLGFRLFARAAIEHAIEEHFTDLRGRAEARAARSRLF